MMMTQNDHHGVRLCVTLIKSRINSACKFLMSRFYFRSVNISHKSHHDDWNNKMYINIEWVQNCCVYCTVYTKHNSFFTIIWYANIFSYKNLIYNEK